MNHKLKAQMIVLSLVLLMPVMGWTETYYLDANNGDDSNSGSSGQPWKTLNRAYTWYSGEGSKVQEGDTVYLRNGTYDQFVEDTNVHAIYYLFHRTNWVKYIADAGHNSVIFTDGIRIRNRDAYSDPQYEPGESYLWFEGITIASGSVYIAFTRHVKLIDCTITAPTVSFVGANWPWYVAGNYISIQCLDADDITIQNCILNKGYRGIHTNNTCNSIIVDGCILSNLSEVGIMSQAPGTIIKDTSISNIGPASSEGSGGWPIRGTIAGTFDLHEEVVQAGTGATGRYYRQYDNNLCIYQTSSIAFDAVGTVTGQINGGTVTNITKLDTIHSDAIYLRSGSNSEIIRNTLSSDSQTLAIYAFGTGTDNLRIENNLIYGNRSGGISVYFEGASGMKINNNTIVGDIACRVDTTHGDTSIVDEMYNNIFSNFYVDTDTGEGYARVIAHGNNIFGNNPDGSGGTYPFAVNGTELVNYDMDSLFVDAANNDYRLKAGSVAIDIGNSTYAPDSDILGNLRDSMPDAGCYEYGASSVDETNSDPELEDDAGTTPPTETLLRISNNVIKAGGNSVVNIDCDVKESGILTVKIYDTQGKEIITLRNKHEEPGTVPITWTGLDSSGGKVGSGIYLIHMECGGYKETKKIAVIK